MSRKRSYSISDAERKRRSEHMRALNASGANREPKKTNRSREELISGILGRFRENADVLERIERQKADRELYERLGAEKEAEEERLRLENDRGPRGTRGRTFGADEFTDPTPETAPKEESPEKREKHGQELIDSREFESWEILESDSYLGTTASDRAFARPTSGASEGFRERNRRYL